MQVNEFKVKRNKQGIISLFTTKPYKKGEMVLDLTSGDYSGQKTWRTIEVNGDNGTTEIDHIFGGYCNHNCDPTCYVDKDHDCLVATKDLKLGDEVNFDYNVSESHISGSFECHCGSDNCRGNIE